MFIKYKHDKYRKRLIIRNVHFYNIEESALTKEKIEEYFIQANLLYSIYLAELKRINEHYNHLKSNKMYK